MKSKVFLLTFLLIKLVRSFSNSFWTSGRKLQIFRWFFFSKKVCMSYLLTNFVLLHFGSGRHLFDDSVFCVGNSIMYVGRCIFSADIGKHPQAPLANIPLARDHCCRGTESPAANLKHSQPDKVGDHSFSIFSLKTS